jgi:hypothetical protein
VPFGPPGENCPLNKTWFSQPEYWLVHSSLLIEVSNSGGQDIFRGKWSFGDGTEISSRVTAAEKTESWKSLAAWGVVEGDRAGVWEACYRPIMKSAWLLEAIWGRQKPQVSEPLPLLDRDGTEWP